MLFGVMRDATLEEQESVEAYLDSISIDTGVNFFDLWLADNGQKTCNTNYDKRSTTMQMAKCVFESKV